MVPRCTTLETSRRAKPMDTLRTVVNAAFSTLLCLAILLWSVVPATSHAPSVFGVLQEHAEMVAEHGHSHGLEEDLAWAMHGHNHDSVDHDHSQAVVPGPDRSPHPLDIYRAAWPLSSATSNTLQTYQIERPPRV